MKPKHLYMLLIVLLNIACAHTDSQEHIVEGYRPIYVSRSVVENIATLAPQPLKNPGKIYVKGNYLFVNEIGKGIHVIDNANPASPERIAFLSIYGNVDIAAKDKYLYADNATDLLTLDISNPKNIIVVAREQNVFPPSLFPSAIGTYFECADPSKGIVAGWEKATLQNPKCRR